MKKINSNTTLQEIAVLVSELLERNGITAVLSGGGAVCHYTENEYMSKDLDFVTLERNKVIAPVIAKLGFVQKGKSFFHPDSEFFVEFPPGPLAFGGSYVESSETVLLKTSYGEVRIITPTQCLMDRISWLIHGKDLQALDQASMVAKQQKIDWKSIYKWADSEGIPKSTIDKIKPKKE